MFMLVNKITRQASFNTQFLCCVFFFFNSFIWLYMSSLCDLQGVTIVKPIVFGNVARYFGKKREEDGHTHQWSVYVKPYRNEVRRPHLYIIADKLQLADDNR